MSGSTAAAARPSSAAHAERRRRLASLLPVAGLAAVTALAYHRIFGLHEVLVGGLVSAVVPVVLVLLWSGTRAPQARPRPLVGSFAICAVAWWIAATALYHRDDAFARVFPTPSLLRRIGADVLDATRGILTTVAPVPGHSDLLVLVSVTAWIAGYAGAELALRGGSTALPALPGLVLLAVPVALSTGAPGDNTWLLAAAVGTAALLL
ncbi:MAG: hypothetical protein HOU01_26185, partial [Streptomycetaceae bacterium]|nr:hypothetical protein [Streptomycetaceae bacterium]